MPLEIKELNIKVSVNQPSGSKTKDTAGSGKSTATNTGQLVDECIEQVIKIINDKKER